MKLNAKTKWVRLLLSAALFMQGMISDAGIITAYANENDTEEITAENGSYEEMPSEEHLPEADETVSDNEETSSEEEPAQVLTPVPEETDAVEESVLEEEDASLITYTYSKNGSNITITGYSVNSEGDDSELVIPSEIDGYTVTAIGSKAFQNKTSVIRVSLPDTVTSISTYAFQNCTSLAEINLNEGLTSIGNNAFQNCTSLVSAELPSTLTSLGTNVFNGCTGLTSVALPASLTSVGSNTFVNTGITEVTFAEGTTAIVNNACAGITGLTKITIPNTVTSIGTYAFQNCTSLAEIDLNEGLTSIGNYAFNKCTALTSVELPSTLKTLGTNVFNGCTVLTAVTLPASLTSVGSNTFVNTGITEVTFAEGTTAIVNNACYGISGLTKVTMPDTVTSIGGYAFQDCTSLRVINLSGAITSIGTYAFQNCTSLEEISLNEGLTNIGNYAFNKCTALTSVTLPSTLTSLGTNVFNGCTGLTAITLPASLTSIGSSTFVNTGITEVTFAEGTTTIANNACAGLTGLTKVTIPDSVTSIGTYAFQNCTSLEEISLNEGLTSIGNYAFNKCTALPSITLPSTLKTLGTNVFNGCTGLTSITLPASLTSVGNSTFVNTGITEVTFAEGTTAIAGNVCAGITGLTKVTIPNTVTSIGTYAFQNCTSLEEINLTEGITSIGNYAFQNCTSLEEISLNEGLTSIGNYAFNKCTALTSVELPSTLKTLGTNVFNGCTGLTSITLPASLTSIGSSTFVNTGITEVTFAEGTTAIANNACSGLTGLTKVTIPNTVTSIGTYAFQSCTSLAEVDLNEGLISIGNYAFNKCTALTSITLPSTLTTLGTNVFNGCTGLTSITLPASLTSVGSSTFANTGITEVTFAEGTTAIASNACAGLTGLTKVTIPDSVTSIGTYAFQNCTSLEEISLNEGLTSIGNYAFNKCTALTSVILPSTLKSLGTYVFADCTGIESIIIPKGVTLVGNYSFKNSIKEITFEEGMKFIPSNACYNATNLEKIHLPESTEEIGSHSFYNCTLLKSINIPDNVIIGSYAFANCTGLTDVSIGKNVTKQENAFKNVKITGKAGDNIDFTVDFDSGLFTLSGSGDIPSYSEADPAPWKAYASIVEEIEFDNNITGIGSYAFDGLVNVNDFELPDKLTKIGPYSFRNCRSITYVEIPSGVKELGKDVFTGCTSLQEIVFVGDAPVVPDDIREEDEEEVIVYIPEVATGWNERLKDKFGLANWIIWDNTVPSKEIVLVLDTSGSMSGRMSALKTAATSFVEGVGGILFNTEISVVEYDSTASTVVASTTNNRKIIKKINKMVSDGGTEYAIALNHADSVLAESDADRKLIVMFSDGEPNDGTANIYSVADSLRTKYGNTIYTVGLLSSDSQRQVLINVAGSESHYFEATDISELINAFLQLSEDIDKKEVTTVEIKRNGVWYDAVNTRQSYPVDSGETAEIRVTPALKYNDVGSIALYLNGQMYLENTEGIFTVTPGTEFKPGDTIRAALFTSAGEELENFILGIDVYTDFTVTYYYNYEIFPSVYKQEIIRAGVEFDPPEAPKRNGYKFTGWYTNESCTGLSFFSILNTINRRKTTGDIDLYAGWRTDRSSLILKDDAWPFINSGTNFCTEDWWQLSEKDREKYKYEIKSGDYSKLVSLLDWYQFVKKSQLKADKDDTWGGSCFGMSSAVVLAKEGDLDIVNFESQYHKIGSAFLEMNEKGDEDVGNVESMINFYQLRFRINKICDIATNYSNSNQSENLRKIVEKMDEDGRCVLLNLSIKENKSDSGGHSVVAYDYKKVSDHEHTFKVYDCSVGRESWNAFTVTITENNGKYTAEYDDWEDEWSYEKNGVYHKNYITLENVMTVDDLEQESILVAPSVLFASGLEENNGENLVSVFTNYPAFTVSNGSLTTVINEGEVVSDNIGMNAYGNINEYGAAKKYYFTLPVMEDGTSYTITPSSSGLNEYRTTLSYENMKDGFFADVSSEQAGTVNVDRHGKVTTSYETASEQEINVCSEEMTTPWYYMTVEGSSTGLTIDPGTDAAAITSSDNATVNVSVENDMNRHEVTDVDLSSGTVQVTEGNNNSVEIRSGDDVINSNTFGYSVVFNSQYGTPVETLTNVPSGSKIAEPADPHRDGYFFEGWYKEDTYDHLWDFENDTVTADTELYAGWSIDENFFITATFKRKKQDDESIYIPKGTVLDPEDYPVLSEDTDGKWYVDSTLTIEWDTSKEFTRNIVLYSTDWLMPKDDYGEIIAEDIPSDGIIPEGIWTSTLPELTYTGSAQKPEIRVYDGTTLLRSSKDYTLSYKNPTNAYTLGKDDEGFNAKKAPSVTIKMKGIYSGSKMITYLINRVDLSEASVSDMSVAYKAKGQKPVPAVTWNGKKLKSGKDYKVGSYLNELGEAVDMVTEPGTYTAVIVGSNGNYEGETSAVITVADPSQIPVSKLKVTFDPGTCVYNNGDPVVPAVTVKDGKKSLTEGTDYTLTLPEEYTEIGTGTVIIKGLGTYVGTRTDQFTIKGTPINKLKVTGIVPATYNGTAQKQEDLAVNGLIKDTDYTVKYLNNQNAGTAAVTITGINAYSGTLKKTFKINALDLNAGVTAGQITVNGYDPVTKTSVITAGYEKSGSKPIPAVEFTDANGKTVKLREKADYTVTYKNNKKPGEAQMILSGTGNFKGKLTVPFTIQRAPETAIIVAVSDKLFKEAKNNYKQTVKVYDENGKTLAVKKDYVLRYLDENGNEIPEGTILPADSVVTAEVGIPETSASYAPGTIRETYRLIGSVKDISKGSFKIASQEYTGKEVTLNPGDFTSAVLSKAPIPMILADNKDGTYTAADGTVSEEGGYMIIRYSNNIRQGTAYVTVKGVGEYSGVKVIPFKIGTRNIMTFWTGIYSRLTSFFN
ncbi:MAG: leucine-rich repeat protein [Solobacterium sp.]|nr:leucine-rich repeat protein [Solobacterium sp.]